MSFKNIVLLILLSFVSVACQREDVLIDNLEQALQLVEADPVKAFDRLNSISNPEQMSKDIYMQYVVTMVQAKYKLGKDISGDTIIFDAEKYFESKGDKNKACITQLYTAWVYDARKMPDKAIFYFRKSAENAIKSNNHLFEGRSLNNIGYLYFEQDIMDSAILNYKKALSVFNTIQGSELSKLTVITNIGRAFEANQNLDSAYLYFKKGLDLAKELNNIPYQATFSNRLGYIVYQKGDYEEATLLFNDAISKSSNVEDSIVIQLNLSILYNSIKQLDSAKHYINIIKERSGKTTDNYVLLEIYKSLANYCEETKNYQEASHYYKLQKEVSDKISEANNSEKLFEAERKYQLSLQQKELQSSQMRLYLYLALALILSMLLAGFLVFKNIRHRQEKEKNKLLESNNQLLVTQNKLLSSENKLFDIKIKGMSFLQSIYRNFIEECTSIEKEVKDLVAEYQTSGEPRIYLRIRKMIEDVKEKTNKQLIENAKELLLSKTSGEKALEVLTDKDLLLLMACYSRYNKTKEIAYILGLAPSNQNIYMKKLDIRNKLERVGAFNQELCEILFPEEEREKSIQMKIKA